MLAGVFFFFLFLFVLLGVLTWAIPLAGLAASAALFLYFFWFVYQSWGDAEVHTADASAAILYKESHGRTPNLPEKFQGVFWMCGNAAPELLATLDGGVFDQRRRRLVLASGAPLNWSYSTGVVGRFYWASLRFSYLVNSKLHFNFNEDYTYAKMPLYMFGCIWVPMGMIWTMQQIDENTWSRDIYLYCNPCTPWGLGSYTLKRVVDAQGRKLPAFRKMMESIEQREKVKGFVRKPMLQIINGRPGGGGCCGLLPGPDKYGVSSGSGGSSSSWSGSESDASSDSELAASLGSPRGWRPFGWLFG